jgi:hypothetical protein
MMPAVIIFFLFFFLFLSPLSSLLSSSYVPKQKLTVQVADVDRVHVDDVEPAEARQRQVLEQLAPEPAGADDEHADVPLEHAGELRGRLEPGRDDAPRAREEGIEGAPAGAQGGRRRGVHASGCVEDRDRV